MENSFQFRLPGLLLSGPGSSRCFGPELVKLGIRKPLIVTDPRIVQSGILERVVAGLKEADLPVGVFDEVTADPPVHLVMAAAEAFQRTGADALIGLGGGELHRCGQGGCCDRHERWQPRRLQSSL